MLGSREAVQDGDGTLWQDAGPGDEELIRQLKDGYGCGTASPAAGDLLYRRHREAALAYAQRCCRDPHDAEDLVSEAFVRTFQAVRSGAGPRGAWRPYLLTVVRHTAIEWGAGDRRALLTADFASWWQQAAGGDPQQRLLAREDRQLLVRSFNTLPERWRAVLWHTLVENDSPAEVAALLGLTPSGVTSLAFRAREGLREAYLHAHVERAGDDRCRHFSGMIGAAIRRGGAVRGRELARHLAGCGSCARAYRELVAVNATLRVAVPAGW